MQNIKDESVIPDKSTTSKRVIGKDASHHYHSFSWSLLFGVISLHTKTAPSLFFLQPPDVLWVSPEGQCCPVRAEDKDCLVSLSVRSGAMKQQYWLIKLSQPSSLTTLLNNVCSGRPRLVAEQQPPCGREKDQKRPFSFCSITFSSALYLFVLIESCRVGLNNFSAWMSPWPVICNIFCWIARARAFILRPVHESLDRAPR